MDPDNRLNDEEDILDICGGLVDRNEKNVAGLAHFTVKEYLVSLDLVKSKASYYHIAETPGNTELAKITYTYLLLEDFSTGPCSTAAELDLRHKEYPLFLYAVQHGWKHLLKYKYGSDVVLDGLLAQFYSSDNDPNFLSWRQAQLFNGRDVTGYLISRTSSPSTLYYISEVGLWQLIKWIIGRGADVNHLGGELHTPLQAAAKHGHIKTLKVLIGCGANTQPIGISDAMRAAASSGHVDCVEALIEAGGTSDNQDIGPYGATMEEAAICGHENVFIACLSSKYWAKTDDSKPFWVVMVYAATMGFDRTIQMLVEKYGSRIICDDNEHFPRTLKTLAEYGRTKTLQYILQKPGAMEILLRDDVFAAVLEGAVYYGHAKMVELLLRNKRDSLKLGVSFHLATARGLPKISEMLLREGADPRAKDEHGWTPMFYAMQCLKEGSVERLLAVLGQDEKSEIMNVTGMGPGRWETVDNSTGLEISEDGCEVENSKNPISRQYPEPNIFLASTSVRQLRAKFPITPVVDDYYFEVHILKGQKDWAIGFVDAMFHYVIDGFELYSSELGRTLRSWCYCSGFIFPEDEFLAEDALPFTTNDIVGCHFDRVRGGVSFTLNGKRACKPFRYLVDPHSTDGYRPTTARDPWEITSNDQTLARG